MKNEPSNSSQITVKNNNHEISIIVPTLNKWYSHEKLGIEDQTVRVEVIIVLQDEESDDLNLTKEVTTNWGTAKYYTLNNKGTSKARNYGMDCATSDLIVFLDDDVRINKNYIDFLLDLFTTSDVSVLCCKIFYGETPPPCSMRRTLKPKSIIDVGGPGSGISSRRSTLLKNNIRFDERLGGGTQIICGEDTKLCIDAWKKNLTILKSDNYSCSHPESGSTQHRRDIQFFRSYTLFIKENFGPSHIILLFKFIARLMIKELDPKSAARLLFEYIKVFKFKN